MGSDNGAAAKSLIAGEAIESCLDQNFLVDGKYAIADLVDLDQLRGLFDKLSVATGCAIGFLDHPGLNILIASAPCPLSAKFHRSCLEGAAVCQQRNLHLWDKLEQPSQTVIGECAYGLADCATPIIIKGKHIASLITGQLLIEPPDRERFRAQARGFGFEEEAYLRALDDVPVFSEERIRSITAFLGQMAQVISQLGYARLTELEKQEKAIAPIRESEGRLSQLIQNSFDTIVILDASGIQRYVSASAARMHGYDPSELVNIPVIEQMIHPDDQARVQAAFRQILETGEGGAQYRHRCKAGGWIHLEARGTNQLNNPDIRGVVVNIRDITARINAEEELRLFMESVENASDAVGMSSPEGEHYYQNKAFKKLFGDIGENPPETLYVDTNVGHEVFRTIMGGGQWSGEVKMYAQDRRILTILLRAYASKDQAGHIRALVGVHTDITERKQVQDRLRQAEKMDAIGQLAGGIAHDFNNQLGSILGCAELIGRKLSDPKLKQYVEYIRTATNHAAELTQQLLAFARKGKHISTSVDLHAIIYETAAILQRSIDKRIEIRLRLDAEPSVVVGDPTQLQNALLNLGLNARDAMPQGGELTFSTTVEVLKESSPIEELAAGRYLVLSVADTGIGMDKSTQIRLFEPFFTTKELGKGTGLGLAAVYGTVKNHGGVIRAYSEQGRGSTFRIHLPLSASAVAPEMVPAEAPRLERGHGRILIVDDEELLLVSAKETLCELGYDVIGCVDPMAALERYRAEWQSIDLVILDMIMPKMGGKALFLAMRQINPQVKALLASGYSINDEAQHILNAGVLSFIQKPFRQETLVREVAEAMRKTT